MSYQRRTAGDRSASRRRATALEERYGAIPAELAGLDPEELSVGDIEEQIAAHGPHGDAAIASRGADAQGLRFEEEPAADESMHEFEPR
jgi:hypothetical protein